MRERPNILVFMSDQQRGDTVRGKARTPVLDAFGAEGVVFTEMHCPSPHCCPSRATFHTGLFPSQHGVWNNVNVGNTLSRRLFEGVRCWSEDLRAAGYQLDFSGKWHVSDHEGPGDHGWTEHYVTASPRRPRAHRPDRHEWDFYRDWGFTREADLAAPRAEGTIPRLGYPLYTHYGVRENPFRDEDVVTDAVRVLTERTAGAGPWCQFVGTLGPHDPYVPPQRFLDLYDPEAIELPPSFGDAMEDKPGFYRKTRETFATLTEREHREAIRHYLAFCSYEDWLFGRVLHALDASGQRENTLVLYLSDHGDYMGDHGLWCKGVPCFRSAYHVPCVARWPAGLVRPGRTVEAFASLADFGPTFLELAGVAPARPLAGASLVPFLRGEEPAAWRDAVFTQTNGNELYAIQRSITTRGWKYVYNGFDTDELYDREADPHEMRNLAREPAQAPRVRELATRLWRFAREHDDVCVNPYIMVRFAPVGPGVALDPGPT